MNALPEDETIDFPLKNGEEAKPLSKPPPYIQTKTGNKDEFLAMGAHILRVRQSYALIVFPLPLRLLHLNQMIFSMFAYIQGHDVEHLKLQKSSKEAKGA
jgi:hypothetical protein